MACPACIIHYDSIRTFADLIKATQKTFETLKHCKNIRESLGNYHVEQCKNLPKFLKKTVTFIVENVLKRSPIQITLMKREMEKDGDQDESSKIQKTARGSLPSTSASLTK